MTPWTIAHQAHLSMYFSRQEYWCGLPFPSPGELPHPGIVPRSPALLADSSAWDPRETCVYMCVCIHMCVCVCVCIKHNVFIHLSVAGYLACPHVFAPVNNATMRSWFSFFYVNTQKSIARSDGHCIFQFLRTLHIVIHNGCTSIHSLFLNRNASTSLF